MRRAATLVAGVVLALAGACGSPLALRAASEAPTVLAPLTIQGGDLDLAVIGNGPESQVITAIKVTLVVPGTAAYRAGLRNGDELVQVNGKALSAYTVADFLPPSDLLGTGAQAVFRQKRWFGMSEAYVAVAFAKRKGR